MASIPKRKALDLWGSVLKSVHVVIMNSNICSISWIIIGVCQLVNKMEETTGKVKAFNRNDEQFLEAFVIFCGLGIQNTQMYEAVERAMAKQMVTLEVGCPCRTPQAPCEHSRPTPPCGSARCLWRHCDHTRTTCFLSHHLNNRGNWGPAYFRNLSKVIRPHQSSGPGSLLSSAFSAESGP